MQQLAIHRTLGGSIGYHVTRVGPHQRLQRACVQELTQVLNMAEHAVVYWDLDKPCCACGVHAQCVDVAHG
eukprot:15459918-Alexandrium_andersonii.AAC.1